MNTNKKGDFQICISVPLKGIVQMSERKLNTCNISLSFRKHMSQN